MDFNTNIILLILSSILGTFYFSFFFFRILNKKNPLTDEKTKIKNYNIPKKNKKDSNILIKNIKTSIFAEEMDKDEFLINEINRSYEIKDEEILEVKDLSNYADYNESVIFDNKLENELHDLLNNSRDSDSFEEKETAADEEITNLDLSDQEDKKPLNDSKKSDSNPSKRDDFLTNNL